MSRRPVVVLLSLATLALVPACKRKAGGRCAGDSATCVNAKSALFCVDGTYQATACRGPNGCTSDLLTTKCDESVAAVGDRCSGGGACSVDRQSMLLCKDRSFAFHAPCKGTKGCYTEGAQVHCDESEADPGDPCTAGTVACTADHVGLLRCEGGNYQLRLACRGPEGCHVEAGKVSCDASVGQAGDPCEEGGSCSADGAEFLECDSGKLAATSCRGKRRCWTAEGTVHCDRSVARIGDDCASGSACSEDGRAMLACVAGKRKVSRRCAHGCTVSGELPPQQVTCR
jgi:hypothetical protein